MRIVWSLISSALLACLLTTGSNAAHAQIYLQNYMIEVVCDDGTLPQASSGGSLSIACNDGSQPIYANGRTNLGWRKHTWEESTIVDSVYLVDYGMDEDTTRFVDGPYEAQGSYTYNDGTENFYYVGVDYTYTPYLGYFPGPECSWPYPQGWYLFNANMTFGQWNTITAYGDDSLESSPACLSYSATTVQYGGSMTETYPYIKINGVVYNNVTIPTIVTENFQNIKANASIVERDFYARGLGWVQWEEWCTSNVIGNGCEVNGNNCPGQLSAFDNPPAPNNNGPWTLESCEAILDIEPVSGSYTVRSYNTHLPGDQAGNPWPGLGP